jgi:hypothetical protein
VVSTARAVDYSKAQAAIVAQVHADLDALWKTIDTANPVAAKAALAELMVTLVDTYGPVSAALAADYFDELRADAAPRGRYRARAGNHRDVEQVQGSSDWAAQPLFPSVEDVLDDAGAVIGTRRGEANPLATLQRLRGASQRIVQSWGRQTLIDNAERDPSRPGWARMPVGQTCDWCRMLASRGAVYTSAAKVMHRADGGTFHDDCDCQPVVVWSDEDLPYDPQPLLDEYLARGSGSKKSSDPQVSAFDAMTREQLELQIRQTEPLKDSPWRTKYLARLRGRLAELS